MLVGGDSKYCKGIDLNHSPMTLISLWLCLHTGSLDINGYTAVTNDTPSVYNVLYRVHHFGCCLIIVRDNMAKDLLLHVLVDVLGKYVEGLTRENLK